MPSILEFAAAKRNGRKLVMVTAYDAWSARLLDGASVDALLVGDSVMNVVHGEPTTLGATTELMSLHVRAVARGAVRKLIIGDMPFLSARRGIGSALDAASALMRAGAHAVKIEGVRGHADVIHHLVESGLPVMGHIGLTPQSVHGLGGYSVQGRDGDAERLKADALAVEQAGAFALVLECLPRGLAAEITASAKIPTIGIGAGNACDGQVLVLHDLLGLNPEFNPRFVRRFAEAHSTLADGVEKYATAVRDGSFPAPKESFK